MNIRHFRFLSLQTGSTCSKPEIPLFLLEPVSDLIFKMIKNLLHTRPIPQRNSFQDLKKFNLKKSKDTYVSLYMRNVQIIIGDPNLFIGYIQTFIEDT